MDRIKEELRRSPLSAIGTILAAIFAGIGLFKGFNLQPALSPFERISGDPTFSALALTAGMSVVSATLSRIVGHISFVAAYLLSVLGAVFVIFLTSLSFKDAISQTSSVSSSGVNLPMVDLLFWLVVAIHLIVNADWTLKRMRAPLAEGDRGLEWLGAAVLCGVWWLLIAGGQATVTRYIFPNLYVQYEAVKPPEPTATPNTH